MSDQREHRKIASKAVCDLMMLGLDKAQALEFIIDWASTRQKYNNVSIAPLVNDFLHLGLNLKDALNASDKHRLSSECPPSAEIESRNAPEVGLSPFT